MIKTGQTFLEFGSGDIRMVSGYKTDGDVFVAFKNQEPRNIGEEEIIDKKINIDDYKVVMTFSKVESIDALIGQLNVAKNDLIKIKTVTGELENEKANSILRQHNKRQGQR